MKPNIFIIQVNCLGRLHNIPPSFSPAVRMLSFQILGSSEAYNTFHIVFVRDFGTSLGRLDGSQGSSCLNCHSSLSFTISRSRRCGNQTI
jgi:hypothetical protein